MNVLEKRIATLRQDEYMLAVVGAAKSGKSKFINALIGYELLPTDILQCTSSIIEVEKSPQMLLETEYFSGQPLKKSFTKLSDISIELKHIASVQEKYRQIPFVAVNDFLINTKNNQSQRTHDNLKKMSFENSHNLPEEKFYDLIFEYVKEHGDMKNITKSIKVKCPFDKKIGDKFAEITIVDTPGVNARGGIEAITWDYIEIANAVIFVHPSKNIENSELYKFYTGQLPNRIKESIYKKGWDEI